MATKSQKPQTTAPIEATASIDTDLEAMIADELLDSIDWAKVRSALITKAKERFFSFFVSGNDTPVIISAHPELALGEGKNDD